MKVNETKNEIIVTKAEYTKAMRIGTKEFDELYRAKQLYPRAKVVIKKTDNKQNYKKLTKTFMLEYAETTDKEFYEELKKAFALIGRVRFDDKKNDLITISFFYVRDKFLNKYPQFMTAHDRKKYEAAKEAERKSEEISNIVNMNKAG
jgi:hypothetical protein